MKNEMTKIPTPETDIFFRYSVRTDHGWRAHSEDLERRLTIAREGLQASVDAGGSFGDLISARRKAEETLKLTAPKP